MITNLKTRISIVFRKHSLPRWMVFLIDIAVVFFSFLIAYILRFNFETSALDISLSFRQAFYVTAVYACFMVVFRSYVGMIRHTTIRDTYKILFTSFCSLSLLILLKFVARFNDWNRVFDVPGSILIINAGGVTVSLFLFRVSVKIFYEFASVNPRDKKNAVIYGCGEMGIAVRRIIDADVRSPYRLSCYIDDDKKLQGKKVNGYTV
ncbi:MAG TPA: hypothetical protein VHO68_13340, partial [Bacteroidales bacterium]|nr:hypothetical protein [Bacteroidales bacterium]